MKKLGRDIRSGKRVEILKQRKDFCKGNKAIVLDTTPPDARGWCLPVHTQFIPGQPVFDEYLCKYEDGSITWVDGKHIFVFDM